MKPILDVCCGSRMFWFDKKNPYVFFGDIRVEKHILCDGRVLEIKPDIQMDFQKIPFPSNKFNLVVFDPPHLIGAGKNGWQSKKYGSLNKDWQKTLRIGFSECLRVLKRHGVLIFKWNEHSIKVNDVISSIGKRPLFGHRTMQNNKTIWMVFMKGIS